MPQPAEWAIVFTVIFCAVARYGVCREKVVRQLKESLGDIFKRDLLTVIAKRGETAEPVVWAMMSDHGTSLN